MRRVADQWDISTLCVTLGADGAAMLHEGRFYRQSGVSVTVVDTVGSGDAFLAAWLSKMFSGAEPQQALAFACAMGAAVASTQGAAQPVSDKMLNQLLARMNQS